MTNFFRHDLNLNNKWWHRLLKVIRRIIIFIICILYFILEKPHYVWTVNFGWLTEERIPNNWYNKIWDLIGMNEYFYDEQNFWENIWQYEYVFNKNKQILQQYDERRRTVGIFCSNNRKVEYLKDIKDNYKYDKIVYSTSIDWDVEIKDFDVALRRITKPCIWITTDDNNLLLNLPTEFYTSCKYIYSIEDSNYLTVTIIRLWWLIKIIVIYSIVALLIYYKWIVYIICWNSKNNKKKSK